jgi:hypothetical protein
MNMKRTQLFSWLAALAVAAQPFVFGCGGAPSQQTAPPAEQQTPAPPPAQVAATPSAAEAAGQVRQPAAATAPVAPPSEAALATSGGPMVQEHAVAGIEVALVEARRTSGDTVTVRWRYRNTTSEEKVLSEGGTAWSAVYRLTMDAYLIDAANKKKYLVITDAEKNPIASKHGDWQGVKLAGGQTLNAWAKFPAPPAEVEKITVNIPDVPPFEDAPIVR